MPSASQAPCKQFVRRRLVRPDGDRRQAAESGHTKNQPSATLLKLDDEIVIELVLTDQVQRRLVEAATQHPLQHLLDTMKTFDFTCQVGLIDGSNSM